MLTKIQKKKLRTSKFYKQVFTLQQNVVNMAEHLQNFIILLLHLARLIAFYHESDHNINTIQSADL
jgi:hypothetical protein